MAESVTSEGGLTRSRGGSWKTRSSTTDERFDGDAILTFSNDRYRDHGVEVWAGGVRIENADGAWQERPSYGFVHPEFDPPTMGVFDGEGAYAGLTALVQWTSDGGGLNLDGVIVASELPPLPVPRGLEADPRRRRRRRQRRRPRRLPKRRRKWSPRRSPSPSPSFGWPT